MFGKCFRIVATGLAIDFRGSCIHGLSMIISILVMSLYKWSPRRFDSASNSANRFIWSVESHAYFRKIVSLNSGSRHASRYQSWLTNEADNKSSWSGGGLMGSMMLTMMSRISSGGKGMALRFMVTSFGITVEMSEPWFISFKTWLTTFFPPDLYRTLEKKNNDVYHTLTF